MLLLLGALTVAAVVAPVLIRTMGRSALHPAGRPPGGRFFLGPVPVHRRHLP
ncbi:hypothetical protein QP028_09545 [Corynebacterium suedekumii]|nr:hypothetical protein QP028_09545 [Corynebacterium suedekumii]